MKGDVEITGEGRGKVAYAQGVGVRKEGDAERELTYDNHESSDQ